MYFKCFILGKRNAYIYITFLCIILLSCGKDSERPPVFHRIQPGCVPSTFFEVEFGSGPSRKFVYNREGQIVYRGTEKLEYKDELLFRIWHKANKQKYTELYYDDLGQLEETRTYDLKSDLVNYDLVSQLKAYYKDGKLVEVENLSSKENYYLTYQKNSNNIDSLYEYYKNEF